MPRPHKPYRGSNAWEKDILRLTTLLRLRCQPAVPYPVIADLLLGTKSMVIRRLLEKCAPDVVYSSMLRAEEDGVVGEVTKWLEGYLEEVYGKAERAEREESVCWKVVKDWEGSVVREMAGKLELQGIYVMEDKELGVQMQWRRLGDWRVWSEPLEPVELGRRPLMRSEGSDDSVEREDDEEVYDEERLQFFENIVSGIVDDTVVAAPVPVVENEKRKRRLRYSVGAPPWSEVPVPIYSEKRGVSWQQLPTKFQGAYEASLDKEHQGLLEKLTDINEKIASYKRQVHVLSKRRTNQVSRNVDGRNFLSKDDINQAIRNSDERSSSKSRRARTQSDLSIILKI